MRHFIEDNNSLKAVFEFGSFIEAIDFVNQVADLAEQLNHHPNINLTGGKMVMITTTTHDEGNIITDLDKKLASGIEELV